MRKPSRLSYANVTATLALVVALSGTAVAAGLPAGSVGTAQLKNRAVTYAKIAPNAVGTSQLTAAARALARSGPATPQLVGGTAGNLPNMSNNSSTVGRWQSANGSGPAQSDRSQTGAVTPPRTMVARNLQVAIANDIPSGAAVYVAVSYWSGFTGQDVDTLACSINGTPGDDRACTAPGPVTIPASRVLAVKIAVRGAGGTVIPSTATWGFTLTPAG